MMDVHQVARLKKAGFVQAQLITVKAIVMKNVEIQFIMGREV